MKRTAVYLAAGASRRFGSNKLMLDLDGTPMYRVLLEKLCDICCGSPEWEILFVARNLQVLEDCAHLPVRIIVSSDSEKGVSYSIKAALEEVPDSDQYVFFVADQPFMQKETVKRFLQAAEGKALACVFSEYGLGNPAAFGKQFREELMALTGDTGGKSVIKKHMDQLFLYPVSEEELYDIDTWEDAAILEDYMDVKQY